MTASSNATTEPRIVRRDSLPQPRGPRRPDGRVWSLKLGPVWFMSRGAVDDLEWRELDKYTLGRADGIEEACGMLSERTDGALGAFGASLAALREAAGLSVEDLAHQSGLDRSYLEEVEAGAIAPSPQWVKAVTEVLGRSIRSA